MDQIHQETGLANSTLSAIERYRTLPTLKVLLPLVNAYGLSVDSLIKDSVFESMGISEDEADLLDAYRKLEGKYKKLATHDVKHHFEVQDINKLN